MFQDTKMFFRYRRFIHKLFFLSNMKHTKAAKEGCCRRRERATYIHHWRRIYRHLLCSRSLLHPRFLPLLHHSWPLLHHRFLALPRHAPPCFPHLLLQSGLPGQRCLPPGHLLLLLLLQSGWRRQGCLPPGHSLLLQLGWPQKRCLPSGHPPLLLQSGLPGQHCLPPGHPLLLLLLRGWPPVRWVERSMFCHHPPSSFPDLRYRCILPLLRLPLLLQSGWPRERSSGHPLLLLQPASPGQHCLPTGHSLFLLLLPGWPPVRWLERSVF